MKAYEFAALIEGGDTTFKDSLSLEGGIYDGHGATLTLKNGLCIDGDGVTLKNFTVKGNISVNGSYFTLEDCTVISSETAIEVFGSHFICKNNTVKGAQTSLSLQAGSRFCLVANNRFDGDVCLDKSFNSVLLFNEVFNISSTSSKNVYIVENSARGGITLTENEYLICDRNEFEYVMDVDNIGVNGDSVTEIYDRAECGALRRLLPHTNKDQFVGEERVNGVGSLPFAEFLKREAANNDVVIIPPGVYTVSDTFELEGIENKNIFAYGVCVEMTEYKPIIEIKKFENVNIRGLTLSYSLQSCGQIHVLEQIDEERLLAVSAAGLDDEFGKTDTARFSAGFTDVFRAGKIYPWGSTGGGYEIEKNGDGTFTLTLKKLVGEIHAGDAIVCRLGGSNKHTLRMNDCKDLHFTDLVVYGYAAALAVVGGGRNDNVTFTRWHNTNKSAPVIDREDYYRYKYLEEQYGVDLGVYIDGEGRYRGTTPLVGSVDATHVVGAVRGFDVTSSILEAMVDDGSNQRSSSSRLADIKDNGDGTTTLTYKGYLAEVYYRMNAYLCNCSPFIKGDRIRVYTSKGVLVCDTRTLSDAEIVGDHEFTITNTKGEPKVYQSKYRTVTVETAAVNFAALEGYDLSDDHYEMKNKVLVDNLSRNSCDFIFDNVIVQNTRSRGMLMKSTGVTAKNCTFKNLAHTALYLSTEKEWGESTVCSDITIQNCVIDHTGFINNYDWLPFLAPVSIVGPESEVTRETLLCKNIIVEGNRFLNNTHDFQVTVDHAQNVKIRNNYFAPGLYENQTKPRKVILVKSSIDVEISDNRYSPYLEADMSRKITVNNSENVFGNDLQ